jgi:signal-transduction protein with cAMP-binding, CBS, and nucleotidyltransferase domain
MIPPAAAEPPEFRLRYHQEDDPVHPDPDRLLQVPLLDGASDEERATLASWLDLEEFRAGTAITSEGRADYAFFVLDAGTVSIVHQGSEIGKLEPGDVFGELALLGDGKRKADAVAESDVVILSMFGTRFREMQTQMPEVIRRLEALAASRRADLDAAG